MNAFRFNLAGSLVQIIMLLNIHSQYSLRYGTISITDLVALIREYRYETAVITDINNSTAVLQFIKACQKAGINGLAGIEFRREDELLFIGIARNNNGFRELNELLSDSNLNSIPLPDFAPEFSNVFVVYPFGKKLNRPFRDYEYIGVKQSHINKLWAQPKEIIDRSVIWQPVTFKRPKEKDDLYSDFSLHRQLRAIDLNILLSQLQPEHLAQSNEVFHAPEVLLAAYDQYPQIIENTKQLLAQCSFDFEFGKPGLRNKQTFLGSIAADLEKLKELALDGLRYRYHTALKRNEAQLRIDKEMEIIKGQQFAAYFLIAWDVVRHSKTKGFYHVGRGSGANSVIAYCIGITDVCPIELDLYFERFLNPKRFSPPDFDIDFSWKDRDEIYRYLFKTYGNKNTALLGTMSSFKDRSIFRELGKIYGLPKSEIDRLVDEPMPKKNESQLITSIRDIHQRIERDFPNQRSIHAGGVLISDSPITSFVALDLPPKGFPTAQFDMYQSEEAGLEKLDILSQRGIGHINECAEIVWKNQKVKVDVHDIPKFKQDEQVKLQLKSGDTIGCFYIESPAMRGLLKKLHCDNYLMLTAASSIIRPGVAKSGMMRSFIHRFHHQDEIVYPNKIMEGLLHETFGVMVYQEDVLKVGHYYGGLDLADADVLRRVMNGKTKGIDKERNEIQHKFFKHCDQQSYPPNESYEIWRQIESFAGFSFSKAHSASYAVESYQSLYLKSHFPLEFMTAVINNFGGFYNTRVYVYEARKAGANICLPCVNKSLQTTTIIGKDIYLGFIHISTLESSLTELIPRERALHGPFISLGDFLGRTRITLEQLIVLIRIGAFRFTGKNKKELLWEAHSLYQPRKKESFIPQISFNEAPENMDLPSLIVEPIEDAYDEFELLGFLVSIHPFDLLRTDFRGDVMVKDLMQHVGKTVRMLGDFVAAKTLRTSNNKTMNFGTFLDANGDFFDTVHFPPSLEQYPLKGRGCYLLLGKVVEDFGFPSIEIERLAKLPIKGDPRA